MDALNDLFSGLSLRSARCTRFEASGSWSYRFPPKPAFKFGTVLRGECWMAFGGNRALHLHAGDAFVLADAPAYVLANNAELPPADGLASFDWAHSDIARYAGDDTVLFAGSFDFDTPEARLMLDSLPPFLRIPAGNPSTAVIHAGLRLVETELGSARLGASLLTKRLVDILMVQVLRAVLDQESGKGMGWIGALTDPRIGASLSLMHSDIAHGWTLDTLASAAAMSRSAFCRRFRTLVGQAPLDYLQHRRMAVARGLLRQGHSVAATAEDVGYASESAFRHAFKRLYGHGPKAGRHGDLVARIPERSRFPVA